METNIILAGVGGQGILSISFVIDTSALKQGLIFKQSEVHGMSQRGGSVSSHLRVADHLLYSDLVPKGSGTLILSVEPLESLRYLDYLSPSGLVVSGIEPFVNITEYPPLEQVLQQLDGLPNVILIDAHGLAREAGSVRAQNMVLLGAASPTLGIREELLLESITEAFAHKGEKVQQINVNAFTAGKRAGQAYQQALEAGIAAPHIRALLGRIAGGALTQEALVVWKELFASTLSGALITALTSEEQSKLSGLPDLPQALLNRGQVDEAQLKELLFN